jgi:integrase
LQTLPHLGKRGNVYQWRRRWRRQSTGIIDIKLSLGTTNLNKALILSRKISAESDIVLEKLVDRQISTEEARKWLANVVQCERTKIEKLKMLQRIDSSDPEDDLRHDEAARIAWQHVSKNGTNAPPLSTERGSQLIEQHCAIIRADLASDARRNIVSRDFRALTGRESLTAADMLTLMNLLIDGKAAAWNRHKEALTPLTKIADALSDADPGFMGHEAKDNPKSNVSPSTISGLPLVPLTTLPTPTYSQTPNLTVRLQETGADRTTPLDCTIASIVQRMNAIKRIENIEEKNLRQYESFAHLFTMLTGIADIRLLRQNHISSFRADLTKLPKSWGKSPKDRHSTREQVLERAKSLSADKVGLSVGTINRHLEHLGQIIEQALDECIPLDPRLNPTKLRKKDPVRDRDKKQAFNAEQLKRIFKTPVWTGSMSEHYQTKPGKNVYKNGTYWCPIIAAYTGARREEIAGFALSDIIEIDGMPCFSIEDNEFRRIKNQSSKRIVPIHNRLIELGFLDDVSSLQNKGRGDLFPDLREPKKGVYGRKLGRHMRTIIDDEFGAEGADLSFNSFRHFVQNTLEDYSDASEKVVRDIVGHEGLDVHQRNYSKRAPIQMLWDAIHELPIVF